MNYANLVFNFALCRCMVRTDPKNAVGMCVAHTERALNSTAVTTASVKTVLVDRIAASVRDPYVS